MVGGVSVGNTSLARQELNVQMIDLGVVCRPDFGFFISLITAFSKISCGDNILVVVFERLFIGRAWVRRGSSTLHNIKDDGA